MSEVVVDDATYIKSSLNPIHDVCKVKLSTSPTGVTQPVTVNYRYKAQGVGLVNIIVSLVQGASTVIASWEHDAIGGTFVTASQTLTDLQFASITDFNDLYLQFEATTV